MIIITISIIVYNLLLAKINSSILFYKLENYTHLLLKMNDYGHFTTFTSLLPVVSEKFLWRLVFCRYSSSYRL